MTTRSTLANLAGGITGLGLLLDRLFNPAICSLYQLSGPAVWEQLSSPVVWERLYGLAVWEVPAAAWTMCPPQYFPSQEYT